MKKLVTAILILAPIIANSQLVKFVFHESNRIEITVGENTAYVNPDYYDVALYGDNQISIAQEDNKSQVLNNKYPYGFKFDYRKVDWNNSEPRLPRQKTQKKAMDLITKTWFKIETGESSLVADMLIGQIFYDTDTTATKGKLFQGKTYDWEDYPKLKSKFDAAPHGFIIDNGDTFTIASHNDFIRAGSTAIGVHVDDTTAPNGLTGTTVDHNPRNINVNTRQQGGNAGRNQSENQDTRNVRFQGDAETAPDHRNAYFGIYGDMN